MIYHNSFNNMYRSPIGAIPQDTEVTLKIRTDGEFDSCRLRLWTHEDKEKLFTMNKSDVGFQISIKFENIGICWYYFILTKNNKDIFYCCKEGFTGGEGREVSFFDGSFQITVYDKNLKTPHWFKNSIMYQIFPDRFNRRGIITKENMSRIIHTNWHEKPYYLETGSSNYDFFGGNFNGIKDKLKYLKELGIDVIYLNPIFESSSNHRYDTGDYMKLDYLLGSEEEFKELLDCAKKVEINIILDGVFNHTGSDSKYFNKLGRYEDIGAFQSIESLYYTWYKFRDFPNQYDCWWGIDTLPNINKTDESFKDYIYKSDKSVINKWMKLGVKGWRLDVADELPNDFIEEFYSKVKKVDQEAVVIAEVWEDASNKRSYGKMRKYVQGKQFDSIMNYPLRNLIIDFIANGHYEEGTVHRNIDANELTQRLLNLYNNYPREIFYSLMNFLSTHDTHRIMTIFEDSDNEKTLNKKAQAEYLPSREQFNIGVKRLKIAWALIATFPGVPCIYYGDEIGLEGYKDPFNRCTYPWGNEDLELFEFFKKMNNIRKENKALVEGDFIPLYSKDDVIAYERKLKEESLIFILNRNIVKAAIIPIDSKYNYFDVDSGEKLVPINNKISINIGPLAFRIIKKSSPTRVGALGTDTIN